LEDVLPQADRIAFASLGELDHFLRNRVGLWVIILADAEGAAYIRVGARHDGDGLRLERLVPEEAVHGHTEHPRVSLQSRRCDIAIQRPGLMIALRQYQHRAVDAQDAWRNGQSMLCERRASGSSAVDAQFRLRVLALFCI
jgi:hypothetical protein